MNKDLFVLVLKSAIRHGLTALSAILVSKKLLDPAHSVGFVDNLSTYLADALPGILALGWSYVEKVEHHEATKY